MMGERGDDEEDMVRKRELVSTSTGICCRYHTDHSFSLVLESFNHVCANSHEKMLQQAQVEA